MRPDGSLVMQMKLPLTKHAERLTFFPAGHADGHSELRRLDNAFGE